MKMWNPQVDTALSESENCENNVTGSRTEGYFRIYLVKIAYFTYGEHHKKCIFPYD